MQAADQTCRESRAYNASNGIQDAIRCLPSNLEYVTETRRVPYTAGTVPLSRRPPPRWMSTSNGFASLPVYPGSGRFGDDPPGIGVSLISGHTSEGSGIPSTFTVVLQSQPMADVTVHFASSTPTEGVTDVTSLTFTNVNWNAPQTVHVTGVNDMIADGDQPYFINFSSTTSADTAYAMITPGHVLVTNDDDDIAGYVMGSISGNTTEAGGTATFVQGDLYEADFSGVAGDDFVGGFAGFRGGD